MGDLASGHLAVRALRRAGIEALFTLSGGHLFPFYDGCRHEGVRLLDTRHEQTAAFAAEGLAKLTRRPQVAAVTAGPGVTNSMSAVASATLAGSPLLLLAGRAPQSTWGRGGLQEVDHVAFMAPLAKHAATAGDPPGVAAEVHNALRVAASAHRGPVFVDVPLDVVFTSAAEATVPGWEEPEQPEPDPEALTDAGALLRQARRPVLVAGTDVWLGEAWEALRALVEAAHVPVVAQGMGRGCVPADHPLALARARGEALGGADLVLVVGAPLDFRLRFGDFGGTPIVHLTDHPAHLAAHATLAAGVGGDLKVTLTALAEQAGGWADERRAWAQRLAEAEQAARADDAELLAAGATPIHPARVYGELRGLLDRDGVVIGDGGDFVSFAGRYLDRYAPGGWLDPGPYGCLGTGLGYTAAARLARPDQQVVALLGDGAAGMSLVDIDTLVRHQLPAVLVIGNNAAWGLEKHPMRLLYDGWHAAADLQPGTPYERVAEAFGAAGERVEHPGQLRPALERALAADAPYLLNVILDPEVAYPRSTPLA